MITGRRWKRSHGGGVMFPRNSVRGNQFGSVTVAGRSTGRMRRCAQRCALTALTFDPDLAALVSIDSTSVRTHQHAAELAHPTRITQGRCGITRTWPTSRLITLWGARAMGSPQDPRCPRRLKTDPVSTQDGEAGRSLIRVVTGRVATDRDKVGLCQHCQKARVRRVGWKEYARNRRLRPSRLDRLESGGYGPRAVRPN
jgi:hypothetical protein